MGCNSNYYLRCLGCKNDQTSIEIDVYKHRTVNKTKSDQKLKLLGLFVLEHFLHGRLVVRQDGSGCEGQHDNEYIQYITDKVPYDYEENNT